MTNNKSRDVVSLQELRAMLTICQKLLLHSHPSAAIMIKYAAEDLDKNAGTEQQPLAKRTEFLPNQKTRNGDRRNHPKDRDREG
ncbi:MAG: hypothetical protein ACR652_03480 [Methylocystis sp.]|uniref:hypothetical protein n=1 Tax=Methylocystis sp. TaxID=1911079 RepID=UPI003DA27854